MRAIQLNRVVLVAFGAAIMAASVVATSSCGGTRSGGSPTTVSSTTVPVTVSVGETPFFDYQFFAVAKKLGWDKQLGLNLKFSWLTQSGPAVAALANGSVDTANTCVVCNYPYYSSVPDLRDFLTTEQFKGFVLIGRKGKSKSYAQYLAKFHNAKKAKKATIEQLRGKTFPIYTANYKAMLQAVLSEAGMTLKDVKVINFADDQKSALAFEGGTGDFYFGGLPAEISILQGRQNQFQIIGGTEILGPAGLWYSNVAATSSWLAKNKDTALKIMAMSYRYNRYVNSKPMTVLPIVGEAMSGHSGTNITVSYLKYVFNTFLAFRTYQEDAKTTYNPKSPLYWGRSAMYYAKQTTNLPKNANYLRQNPLNQWFKDFLARKDLRSWVDAPLK